MGRRRSVIPVLSFSWKRAIGLSAAKARISRQIGIPRTRNGRQRKAGAALGCCIILAIPKLGLLATAFVALNLTGCTHSLIWSPQEP